MRFAKAHGLGNDFVLVEDRHRPADAGPWARRLCDRHRGVGGDGVIAFARDPSGVAMRLFNADGGEAELSGNGVRCLGAYAVARGWAAETHQVRTAAGPRAVAVRRQEGSRYRVETGLGRPVLDSASIPTALAPPRPEVVGHRLEAAGGVHEVTATSLGNPHCAVFLDAPASDDLLAALGAGLETHPFFPRRTNVELVTVLSRERIRVRFWERGVGRTSASGTGAASAVVAAILNGLTGRVVEVVCDGGELLVEWPEGGEVRQAGEVELLFEGDWLA